jgi:hypothetical protein
MLITADVERNAALLSVEEDALELEVFGSIKLFF